MKGEAKNFVQIFAAYQVKFLIPVYQRNYDWQIEHCQRLFDDLEDLAKTGRDSHFFGSIVSKSVPTDIGSRILIDGQQRVTTCFLLLFALVHQVANGKLKCSDPTLVPLVTQMFLINQFMPKESRLRLKPIKKDQEAFNRIAEGGVDLVEVSNVTANYRYFLQRLESTELTADQIKWAFEKLTVIDIVLDEHDDAQLIFESLNSTGLDLSEGDKIRNFILMSLPMVEQEQYYDDYWAKIEKLVDLRPGDVYEVSAFIRDYLAMKNRKTPAWSRIYGEYRKYFKKNEISSEEHLKDLLYYAKIFHCMHNASMGNPEIDRVQRRLNILGMSVINPFLFALYKFRQQGGINDSDVAMVLRTVETFLFRRFVCKEPTNALNKIFETLHSETVKSMGDNESYLNVLNYLLLNREGNRVFPRDEEFLKAFGERDFYHIQGNRYYLFDRLENEDNRERIDIVGRLDDGTFSIEHIMPQTLTSAWKQALGPDYEAIHQEWLHRIANLTLTAYNSTYSNSPFSEKRDVPNGFRASGFRLNGFVKERERWTIEELKARTELLKNQAQRLWPMPISSYCPPETVHEKACLSDHELLTGRKIAAFTFMGARFPVKTWVDMTLGVLRQLHVAHPTVLASLLEEKDFPGSMFRATPDVGYQKVAENFWVYLATPTVTKVGMLTKILYRCGVDTEELTFELYRDSVTK